MAVYASSQYVVIRGHDLNTKLDIVSVEMILIALWKTAVNPVH